MTKLFGTDGIRGTPGVYPLTDEMLAAIAQGAARSLGRKSPAGKNLRITIGKDTRLSGGQIEKILCDNIRIFGGDVLLAGTITTPGLSYLAKHFGASIGIMISASHNKPTDNGIKFFNAQGHKFSLAQEHSLEEIISRNLATNLKPIEAKVKGKLYQIKNAQEKYADFLASTVKGLDLKGVRVALDCAWGAAAPFAKAIFTKLGAQVHSIHDKPSGHIINEGGAVNPGVLKELVLEAKADIGIALDGDGDRGILVDETGHVLDGDCTLAIIARYMLSRKLLAKNTVVGTVMSNFGLKVALEECGGKIIQTNVGDKYVLEALLKEKLNLGGEQSGHIIFLDYLSTPSGLLTALQMLKVMRDTKKPLSELTKCLTKYPQILVNVKVKEKRPFEDIPEVEKKLKAFTAQLKDDGRVLLRYSGTEALARVMVEGINKEMVESIAYSLASSIREEIGLEKEEIHA